MVEHDWSNICLPASVYEGLTHESGECRAYPKARTYACALRAGRGEGVTPVGPPRVHGP